MKQWVRRGKARFILILLWYLFSDSESAYFLWAFCHHVSRMYYFVSFSFRKDTSVKLTAQSVWLDWTLQMLCSFGTSKTAATETFSVVAVTVGILTRGKLGGSALVGTDLIGRNMSHYMAKSIPNRWSIPRESWWYIPFHCLQKKAEAQVVTAKNFTNYMSSTSLKTNENCTYSLTPAQVMAPSISFRNEYSCRVLARSAGYPTLFYVRNDTKLLRSATLIVKVLGNLAKCHYINWTRGDKKNEFSFRIRHCAHGYNRYPD